MGTPSDPRDEESPSDGHGEGSPPDRDGEGSPPDRDGEGSPSERDDGGSPPHPEGGELRSEIDDLWGRHETGAVSEGDPDAVALLDEFLAALEAGTIRAASPPPGSDGRWTANGWVKRGVLLNFSLRPTEPREHGGVTYHDVLGVRGTDGEPLGPGTRNTPDGTVVRRGASVGEDCILMSPSFVNVGARIGDGALVDSCVTVGSCAQVGADVKVGANTLVGGVLEPVEDAPVVVEEGATLGAGCRVTSGFVVGRDSVVAEGTLLTPRIPVYDLVDEAVLFGRLPPERRAFTRYVPSSLGEHELFEEGAFKPAVVALDVEADTREAVQREEALRS